MKNDTAQKAVQLDFTEQTPQMQIGEPKLDPLYRKAFLEQDTGESGGFGENTTSRD